MCDELTNHRSCPGETNSVITRTSAKFLTTTATIAEEHILDDSDVTSIVLDRDAFFHGGNSHCMHLQLLEWQA